MNTHASRDAASMPPENQSRALADLPAALKMRIVVSVIPFVLLLLVAVGCGDRSSSDASSAASSAEQKQTLLEAKRGFVTRIVSSGESFGAPTIPPGNEFGLIHYQSPAGSLAAYLTADPGDGKKHPAIVWITGGDNNTIDDVWSSRSRDNDQSASAFRDAGVVMMFPSQRGGNDNPGKREGFLGEVDDILAAAKHLAQLPYVDPDQIYLGGHSTGGTLAMLVGSTPNRFRAVFALGPVGGAVQYGGDYVYCDPNDEDELALRSPLLWMHCVETPMFVFEGANEGNWDVIQQMKEENTNPNITFFRIPGRNHFSVIAPITELLAAQIASGKVNVTRQSLKGLR